MRVARQRCADPIRDATRDGTVAAFACDQHVHVHMATHLRPAAHARWYTAQNISYTNFHLLIRLQFESEPNYAPAASRSRCQDVARPAA